MLPGFAAAPDSIVSRVGFARTKDLWALSQSGLEYVRNAVRDDAMPGIDAQDGWLYVSKTNDGDAFTHLVALLGELGEEIEGWPTERVRAVLRSERYFHAIHYPRAINIHPLNYALGMAAAAERAGARIFEHTPALSIDPAGVRKRVVTPNARLRANHVVLCGNLQIAALLPRIAAALIPITTYVITTAPLGPRLAEAISYRGAVSDCDLADNHYRIVDGDRLMWSGRATAWARNPRRYVRALTRGIKKTYPQLGKVAVDYAWSGTLGNSIHRMPQIGELAPGLWLASGFGGHGLNTTAMAGNLIARAIVDGDQTWRQFTPFELVWAGGILGRATAQMYYWIKAPARLRSPSAARVPRTWPIAAPAKPKQQNWNRSRKPLPIRTNLFGGDRFHRTAAGRGAGNGPSRPAVSELAASWPKRRVSRRSVAILPQSFGKHAPQSPLQLTCSTMNHEAPWWVDGAGGRQCRWSVGGLRFRRCLSCPVLPQRPILNRPRRRRHPPPRRLTPPRLPIGSSQSAEKVGSIPAYPGAPTNLYLHRVPAARAAKARRCRRSFSGARQFRFAYRQLWPVTVWAGRTTCVAALSILVQSINGLGDVNLAVQLGAFAAYWPVPWLRLRAEIRQGIGGETGQTGDVFLDAVVPFGQWRLSGGPAYDPAIDGRGVTVFQHHADTVGKLHRLGSPGLASL